MKERLTGAIILVALIVLLVPELLTGPLRSKPTAGIAVRPPTVSGSPAGSHSAQPEPPIRSYTLSLTNTSPVTGATAAGGLVAAAETPGAQAAPSGVKAKGKASRSPPSRAAAIPTVAPSAASPSEAPRKVTPVHRAKTLAASAAASKRSSPAAPAHRTPPSPGWVVQLGYFSVHANALHLAHRLRVKGFRVSVSAHRVRGRILWRVWSGPLGSRAAAVHLARRLRSAGLRGEVLPG